MRTRFLPPAAARSIRETLPVLCVSSCPRIAISPGLHASVVWQRQHRRFRSTASVSVPLSAPSAAPYSGCIRSWERPLIAEVYRQLRGQHIEGRVTSTHASATGSIPAAGGGGGPRSFSIPGWEYTLEDERGLRFGSAYMLLTLAWNRKFNRLRDLLVNANRAREGSKQVIARVLTAIASDLSSAGKQPSEAEPSADSCTGSTSDTGKGCLGGQLQQLLQHQVAFLAHRGLGLHTVLQPQRVVVDSVYGIVGCTRGSSAASSVLLQHGSVQVLQRRGSSSSSRSAGTPATLYMIKPRSFDFEGAVAAAEAASGCLGSKLTGKSDSSLGEGGEDIGDKNQEEVDRAFSTEKPLCVLERRQQHMATESVWRKRAREHMQEILRQPLTFRQFMNMCADCGSAIERGFVLVMDFKLLCAQQLAILDSQGNVVMGSEEDEAAVHTLRLELNAKFDAANSNFIFPAFEPSGWQLIDWNYAIGPQYPVDPREITNVVIVDEDKELPSNAVTCFV